MEICSSQILNVSAYRSLHFPTPKMFVFSSFPHKSLTGSHSSRPTQGVRSIQTTTFLISPQRLLDGKQLHIDIENACQTGDIETALSSIINLEKQGIPPESKWILFLVHSCARSRSFSLLEKLLSHLRKSSFRLIEVFLTSLAVLYCKLGSKRHAGRAIEELHNLSGLRSKQSSHDNSGSKMARKYDPKRKETYEKVIEIHKELRKAGYVPDTSSVLHDIDQESKERALMYHSERVAITYGLINTPPGTTLRVMKNLRICGDCHSAIKIMSKVVKREIIVRDNKRFHHFRDGLCSCGDYW